MENHLNEKAVSKSQQRLFGMVTAYKNGKLDLDSLDKLLAKKIKSIADGERKKTGDKRKFTKGMDNDEIKKIAKTKHDKIPEKVEESKIDRMERSISVNTQNQKKVIEQLINKTDYTKEELNSLTLSELEDLYLTIDIKSMKEQNILKYFDFINEAEQNLEGGKAEGKTLEDIAKKHNVPVDYFYKILEDAIRIEMEHTTERSLAEQIVKDHLTEHPLYYNKEHGLPAMEEKLEEIDKVEVDEIVSSQIEDTQQIKKFSDFTPQK